MNNSTDNFYSFMLFAAIGFLCIFVGGMFLHTNAEGAVEATDISIEYVDFPPVYIKAEPIKEFEPNYITVSGEG